VHVESVGGLGDDGLGLVRAGGAFAAVCLVNREQDDRIERIVRGEADSLQSEHSGYTSRGLPYSIHFGGAEAGAWHDRAVQGLS
jgi:hypothetical protein